MSPKSVVFDTNCWVSLYINSEGTTGQATALGLAQYTVFHSPETLNELRAVLSRPGFDRYAPLDDRMAFVNAVAASGMAIQPLYQFQAFNDPADNKFFDLAYSAGSPYLVSGDEKHVLPLKFYHGIEMLSPAQFLQRELQKAGQVQDTSQGMELKKDDEKKR